MAEAVLTVPRPSFGRTQAPNRPTLRSTFYFHNLSLTLSRGCTLGGNSQFEKGRKSVILRVWAAPGAPERFPEGGGASPTTFFKGLEAARRSRITPNPFCIPPTIARKLSRPKWSQRAQHSASGLLLWFNVIGIPGVFKKVFGAMRKPRAASDSDLGPLRFHKMAVVPKNQGAA